MAKLPRSGSRRGVADYVHKRLVKDGHDNLKAIQPQVLVGLDDDVFYWSVLIISIHEDASGVGIQRKYEEGFEVVEDNKGKYSSKLRVMKPCKICSTSKKSTSITKKKAVKKLPTISHGRKR